jgi:aminoglycoside 3-N-acetyltransferase
MGSADERPTVTRESIAADLSGLGVRAGDVVFLHSSLKSLGWVDGGADAVVDAFLDVVGPEGLLIVPTLTFTFATGELACHAFDAAETPSRVGAITEALRRRPPAHRSEHPTHSIAAIGRRAGELVLGHEATSTFGRDGPYRRYVDWGAKILFLGVDVRSNTTLHAVEDWLDLPYMAEGEALVKGPDGQPHTVKVAKSPQGDRDFYRRDSKVERLLESRGLLRRGRVGAADTIWMPSQEMVAVVVEGIHEEPTLLLCDRDDCEFCGEFRRPTIDHVMLNRPTI